MQMNSSKTISTSLVFLMLMRIKQISFLKKRLHLRRKTKAKLAFYPEFAQ